MDLAIDDFKKGNLGFYVKTFSIPIGIMVLIAMMVIPLNPILLDILFIKHALVCLNIEIIFRFLI